MGLLHHFLTHGTPVTKDAVTYPECLHDALQYGCNESTAHDTAFILSELVEQTSMGLNLLIPWSDVQRLPGIWIIPLELITQEGLNPQLIYNYIWSGLNTAVLLQDPVEPMQFGKMLPRLL